MAAKFYGMVSFTLVTVGIMHFLVAMPSHTSGVLWDYYEATDRHSLIESHSYKVGSIAIRNILCVWEVA